MKKGSFLLLWVLVLGACEYRPGNSPLFELLPGEKTGIMFSNDLTDTPDFNILEYLYYYNGGGVAAGDFNNDGLPDLYFVANQKANKLYLNKDDFQFEDITESAGVAGTGTWSTGVTVADVNGDGLLDIYLCQVGNYKEAKGANQLFINNGDLTFTESAKAYGLDFVGFSTQAAFFDYDRDGDLDMYLLNHSIKDPSTFSQATNRTGKDEMGGDRLYQSQLSQGETIFTDVTESAGIYSSSLGFGLGLAVSDVNNDGWADIYISNDFTENDYLYINQQDGTFTEQLEQQIAYTSRFSMGNTIDDLDNDGLTDIITTDMLPADPDIWQKSVGEDKAEVYDIKLNFGYGHQYVRNTLQKNLGNGSFSDVSLQAGTFATDWSWAPLAFDMDGDGQLDLHISNGIYKRPNDLDYVNYGQDGQGAASMSADELEAFQIRNLPTVKIPNYAGRNLGDLQFESMGEAWGLDQETYSNGSVYADLDNDGDHDLVLNNTNQQAFVYENKTNELNAPHYLKIQLKGPGFNTYGVGARVKLETPSGKHSREVMSTKGFQSAMSPTVLFNIGEETTATSLTISWPDGKQQYIPAPSIDTLLVLDYKPGENQAEIATSESHFEVTSFDAYVHRENVAFKDYDREYLIPRKYSTEGPAVAKADVNGDGLEDLYLGGAKEQPGTLWLQQADGSFEEKSNTSFAQLARAEDVDALFFDANGDTHPDLYVISAGNEYADGQVFTFDRLYLNDGSGNLQFSPRSLPQFGTHGKTVKAADIDGDGDQDLFLGANIVNGVYGLNPAHHLLINNGQGFFQDVTAKYLPMAQDLGMINDAAWFDFDQDGDQDLLLAGEWTPLILLQNDGNGSFSRAEIPAFDKTEGWWFSLALADLDGDGDQDIIAGNLGLNSKLKASKAKPLTLYLNDFDQNGQPDPVLFHYMGEEHIPFATRDDLIKQMAFIKKKHPDYKTYAEVKAPEDLFEESALKAALKKQAFSFASAVFINQGSGSFDRIELPLEAQLSPVMDIQAGDLNVDGHTDLFLVGNFYGFRNDIGRAGARPVTWLLGSGDGQFKVEPDKALNTAATWGEYRKLVAFENQGRLLGLRNNQSPVWFRLKTP